ncbi:DUF2878 domain-containing protein [Shewanella youngdeokensis]|uniref:DUF2878 domain-containing protein n=1 Tax=Shewanella youngdeokensis TaxID=2999068 RepID=A0ABZ0K330_9GAMM|nr:DUF2878 domain-containing protein [Shewanella sp. DAU334]
MLTQIYKLAAQHLTIVNLVMFQSVWWMSILYQNRFISLSFALLLIHFMLSSRRQSDLALMFTVTAVGAVIDPLLIYVGVFVFSEPPYWLLLLWCHFAISLRYSMGFTQKLPWYTNAIIGGVFGCLSYLAGARFNVVHLPLAYFTSVMILFAIWFVIFPMFVTASRRIH